MLLPRDARTVYVAFLAEAVASRSVWSLQCHGDLVVLTGAEAGFFPLWPDVESARFFSKRHWPGLEPTRVSLRELRVTLRALARARVRVGVGLAPHPEAVVLEANRLRRDLATARRLHRSARV